MSDVIQPLLDRIHSEGLQKAEEEKAAILKEAHAKAEDIVAKATSEADRIREEAEREADATRARGITALEQAARDVLLRLRTEIARQVKLAARSTASATLSSSDIVAGIITDLVNAQVSTGKVEIEAHPELAEKLKQALPALLKDAGSSAEADIIMNPKTQSGFTLRLDESAEGLDLTDTAVAEWISAGLRKDIADLLTPATSED
jgi:cell division septum initiation protein DivIVA